MITKRIGWLLAALLMLPAAARAGDTADAMIGGGFGGAVGAALGNEVGGRDGAILGGAVGAMAGVAIATDDGPRVRRVEYGRPYYYSERRYYGPPPVYYAPRPYYRVVTPPPPPVYYAPRTVYVERYVERYPPGWRHKHKHRRWDD